MEFIENYFINYEILNNRKCINKLELKLLLEYLIYYAIV
jgi:hypothetical protein